MGEKRFDVHIPDENTEVLEKLLEESRKTGVSKARLIVVWLTRYVEMTRGNIPPLVPPNMVVQAAPSNGHHEEHSSGMQPVYSDDVLSSYLDED